MGTALSTVSTLGRWLRFVVVRLLAYPVIAYFTVGVLLFLWQNKLIYPAPKSYPSTPPRRPRTPVRRFADSGECE